MHLVQLIQNLTIGNYFEIGLKELKEGYLRALYAQLLRYIGLLSNLRSFQLSWQGWGDDHELCLSMWAEGSMPTLAKLKIDTSSGTKNCCLESLLQIHPKTLKSVHLRGMCVDYSENTGEWNKMLESLKCLRPETVLVISVPVVKIEFDEFNLTESTPDGSAYSCSMCSDGKESPSHSGSFIHYYKSTGRISRTHTSQTS